MNRLKKLREARELTQKELAKELGISQVSYSRYETGYIQADYETLLKLSKFFNVSINYLLGEENQNLILITKQEFEKLKEIETLAKIIQTIDQRNKD